MIELKEGSALVSYDLAALSSILSQVGVNQLITITFPDATTFAFYGTIDEFAPKELKEGEEPQAEMKIIPTMQTGMVETAPVYTGG